MIVPRSAEEVHALRESVGFVTPLRPMEPGRPWCVFSQRGTYEWICHPDDAERFIAEGVTVDGVWLECEWVEDCPFIGGVHIKATDVSVNTTFLR